MDENAKRCLERGYLPLLSFSHLFFLLEECQHRHRLWEERASQPSSSLVRSLGAGDILEGE